MVETDTAVGSLLEDLQQLLLHHSHLISDARNLVEKLVNDLHLFKAFLKDSTKMRRNDDNDGLRELARQIRDAVCEAEYTIDAMVTQAAESETVDYFLRAFQTGEMLLNVAADFEKLGTKVSDIYGDIGKLLFAGLSIEDEEPEAPIVRQDRVVGFQDEAEKLVAFLTEKTPQLDVISIVGMPGLGKTTLARMIFRDPAIQYEFPTRIWIYVSLEFTRKDVFLTILKEFITVNEHMHRETDHELARLVSAYLERRKFLIVMDDVWTTEDWDKLQIALPKGNTMGKVLITTRQEEVALYANRNRCPHKLRFLTCEESWLLLQLEVFRKPECPPELEVVGRLTADRCYGLPLPLVVIGGILVKKISASNEISAMQKAFEEVSQSIGTCLYEDNERRMEKIISLSYNTLPYHLRPCFLYLGMFPEDFEIPVSKLIQMWIAEGFIPQKDDFSMEDTAENYLEDLISRNLVSVEKIKANGKVKTCRMHDMLRDFCKCEAQIENFFQEMKLYDGSLEPPFSRFLKFRRLCIHSNILSLISLEPYGPRIRSFVCFSKEEITLPVENITTIPAAFKVLRVLDAKPIKFTKVPRNLYELVHLRYIVLSSNLAILPAAFSKLWNLQTLIVETTSPSLEIKVDIWEMIQLRHLKTNTSATLPKTSKSSKGDKKLQTLGTVSPQSCTKEVLDRACSLKKLGIRGQLAFLLDVKNGSFDGFVKLSNLEKLKLLNDIFYDPLVEGKLLGLPPPYKFPPKLRSLTLSDTFLDWSQMTILGLLENLEILNLKDKAFMGKKWVTADGGFHRLEVLHIGSTNLVFWVASGHHFPRLRRLELMNCEELQEVPIGLADIPSLQLLDLYHSKSAAASAKKIREAKERNQYEQNFKYRRFRVSIFPAEE